ncbi:hypothetical protein [Streptomyces sp. NPDC093795]|uniref:hypothetical protein n=1 Tax=Streptomyces sp. NPDC093795 TaxID=3366051 RepID=UPI00382521CB
MHPVRRAPRVRAGRGVRAGPGVRDGGDRRRVGGDHGSAARGPHHPRAVAFFDLAWGPFLILCRAVRDRQPVPFLFPFGVRVRVRFLFRIRIRLRFCPCLCFAGAYRGPRYAPTPGARAPSARADRHRGAGPVRVEGRAQRRPRPQRLRLPRGPAGG